MAEVIEKTYLDQSGVEHLVEKLGTREDTKDAATLKSAKAYADGLADNYDAAGTAQTKVDELANGQVKTNKEAIDKLNGADTVEGSVAKQVKDAKDAVDSKIGTMDDLKTAAKGDLVSAVNELKESVGSAQTAGEVTVDTTLTTEGMAKSYTIKQNNKTVATIDIPKDMVVKSGTVEKNPTGQEKGTYLVLTLANATEDKVYVNVGSLVDIYTAKASATQIQIAIDASTREISATIVAGSVTATEIADAAIVTAKIADGNVTKAKLSKDVQTSLGKADTAIQEADLTDLKSDVAANKQEVADLKTSLAEGGATATAIADAKKAGDGAAASVSALEKGQVATNKTDIAGLKTKVENLESVNYVAITNEQIDAMFA